MTACPVRAHAIHRPVRGALILAAVLLTVAMPATAHALTVPVGTYTLSQDETHASVTIGPTAAVYTNGHTLTITGNGGLCCLSLLLAGGHLYINSTHASPGKLVLSGAASHSIGAHGAVELMDSRARLEITADATVHGAGRIVGRNSNAVIAVALGRKLTSQLGVLGAMRIVGPGTFRNEALLSALGSYSTSARITLTDDLNLEDEDTALWDATAAALQFDHAQTGASALKGAISVRLSGVLEFRASIECELFIWSCGTLSIDDRETLSFWQYSPARGSCLNPSDTIDPYAIPGPYDATCDRC